MDTQYYSVKIYKTPADNQEITSKDLIYSCDHQHASVDDAIACGNQFLNSQSDGEKPTGDMTLNQANATYARHMASFATARALRLAEIGDDINAQYAQNYANELASIADEWEKLADTPE